MAMILLVSRKMVSAPHSVALRLFHVQHGMVEGTEAEKAKVGEIERVFLDWGSAPQEYRDMYPRHYEPPAEAVTPEPDTAVRQYKDD